MWLYIVELNVLLVSAVTFQHNVCGRQFNHCARARVVTGTSRCGINAMFVWSYDRAHFKQGEAASNLARFQSCVF